MDLQAGFNLNTTIFDILEPYVGMGGHIALYDKKGSNARIGKLLFGVLFDFGAKLYIADNLAINLSGTTTIDRLVYRYSDQGDGSWNTYVGGDLILAKILFLYDFGKLG